MSDYDLHLNFLAAAMEIPDFSIFRKKRSGNEEADASGGIFAYDLPVSAEDITIREDYFVSLAAKPGFHEFTIPAAAKIDLTRRVLLESLKQKCAEVCEPSEFVVPDGSFVKEIDFRIAIHPEGEERVALQPYFLRGARRFGFLVDFHFRRSEGQPFNRRIQQLSLSLDANYRRNLDHYTDRIAKIRGWIQQYHSRLFPLTMPGTVQDVAVEKEFLPIPARQLRSKIYIANRGREYRGQFVAVKDGGPLEELQESPQLLFIFRAQDREAARRLARALKGSERRLNFVGFDKLFRTKLTISSDPVVLRDFSRGEMERTLEQVQQTKGPRPIPVLVMPKDEEAYLIHKAVFTHAGVPTQVCSTETINDEYDLKWSVANIALQLFCKAGGIPWKVKPVDDKSLIIGISQSHKLMDLDGKRHIEKYFAFSILTDSSGIFQSLEVMGQSDDQAEYLAQLKSNLERLLREQSATFQKVVLHTSFRLKRIEMDVIEEVARTAAAQETGCLFAVVKVNQRNRFFAVNRSVNSLVPYEASYLHLGPKEYLLWFEGVFPDNPNVKKAFPGPTHLEFLRITEKPVIGDTQILQDLVNLSGANWRGFNAKSTPISIFYCHLVAEFIGSFQEKNLPLPKVTDLKPWFL
jgi:hypothetical protein